MPRGKRPIASGLKILSKTLKVFKAASTTKLKAWATSQKQGTAKPITLTASVAVNPGSESGMVLFRDGNKALKIVELVHSKATYKILASTAVGKHHYLALFKPSSPTTVAASNSGYVTITVSK